ncbi:hypothetical protein WAI453_010187 [Rhynchosporium graminicola]
MNESLLSMACATIGSILGKSPSGYTSVPVELDNDGRITHAEMIAGSVGMLVSSSGLELTPIEEEGTPDANPGVTYDTIQPASGWCMYEVEGKNAKAGKIE